MGPITAPHRPAPSRPASSRPTCPAVPFPRVLSGPVSPLGAVPYRRVWPDSTVRRGPSGRDGSPTGRAYLAVVNESRPVAARLACVYRKQSITATD